MESRLLLLAGRIASLAAALAATGAVVTACNGDSRPPGDGSGEVASNAGGATGGGGSTSSSGGAGGATAGTHAGGMAGAAGDPGDGGEGAVPPDADVCGDGSVGLSEECEPGIEIAASCSSVGFESGVLRCGSDCSFDKSECRGTERCADGRDNDGDGGADCSDTDCSEACAQSCEAPIVLTDGTSISASTEGRGSLLTSSCAGGGGSELVVELTAETTGKLDAWVSARGLVALSLRTSCEEDTSEVACVLVDDEGGLSIDVTSGQVLFAVVEGYAGALPGNVTLRAASRAANACGDTFVDDAEECDDGGEVSEDGCSSTCHVEVTESEPNDSPDEAEPYADPTYALISPEGDVDYFTFVVEGGPKAVTIEVFNVGSGFCSSLVMDPFLELYDDNGELVAEKDDGGEGYCSRLVLPALDDGEYLVAVRESAAAPTTTRPTFGYEVSVSTD